MSKSDGTFVRAATYLKHLDPGYVRYYYASKLTPRVDDLDLNLDEFVAKVNKVYQELLKRDAPFMTFVFCGMQSAGSRIRVCTVFIAQHECDHERGG